MESGGVQEGIMLFRSGLLNIGTGSDWKIWAAGAILVVLLVALARKVFIPMLRQSVKDMTGFIQHRNENKGREARLNYVICYHCHEGRGVLNPVYVTYDNMPHIEGYCTTCGRFIRARLK